MSRSILIKRIAVLALALVMCVAFAACGGNSGNKSDPDATPTATPVPTPVPSLEPQAEINDPGDPITYHVSNIFSDNMVVQRGQYVTVWGWADQTSGYIYGEFMGEKRYAEIGSDGYFKLLFSPHEANTYPSEMKIYPKNGETTTFTNVVVGDVWIVDGQSNAELTMSTATAVLSKEEKSALKDKVAADSNIRVVVQSRELVIGKQEWCATPQKEVVRSTIHWYVGKDKSAWSKSSAIGYYFALAFHDHMPDVPVGIIMMGAGGASLCELMPAETAEELGINYGTRYYNAMTAPFVGLPFTGMLFYQGESNANGGGYKRYANDLKGFVEALREKWGFDFPVYNVQLSCHGPDCSWTEVPQLRNSQFQAEKIIPNYYLIVSMDVGFRTSEGQDWAHPKMKEPVGRRLAYAAFATIYGTMNPDEVMSPEPVKIEWKSDEAILTFNHVANGLTLAADTGDKLVGFTYFEGGRYYDAEATIISANQVSVKIGDEATSVGYGMKDFAYPEDANLVSSTGYPAPAFEFEK